MCFKVSLPQVWRLNLAAFPVLVLRAGRGGRAVHRCAATGSAGAGAPPPPVRFDPKDLTSFIVSNDEFFAVSHYGIPTVDASTYKLRITGLVERPLELTLADLKKRPRVEHAVGFECSGNNNARGNPLVGNARWAGRRARADPEGGRAQAERPRESCSSPPTRATRTSPTAAATPRSSSISRAEWTSPTPRGPTCSSPTR